MSKTRLFCPAPLRPDCRFTLDAGQTRYLARALRLRAGEKLTVFDGSGGEYLAEIVRIGKRGADIQTGALLGASMESPLQIRLLQGLSKGDRMDTVVQKATELGVQRISPLLTDHSVVKIDGQRATRRREHWQKIAQSACEQCGRNIVPAIDEAISLNHWFDQNRDESGTRLVFRPKAATPLSSVGRPTAVLTILIGPEGGFSSAEYECAAAAGFGEVSLGPRVLRTETATIAAVSAAQTLWGDYD
jgi:16S rRNA (uracil1498-N3)-methyltransferase